MHGVAIAADDVVADVVADVADVVDVVSRSLILC